MIRLMQRWVVWGVLLCLGLCQALPGRALEKLVMPDYHVLLEPSVELPASLKLVQDLLAGRIDPDSDWAELHPQEAETLFIELLSDAVMAESSGVPGLIPDHDQVLAALTKHSRLPRLQRLEEHYRLWRSGQYTWQETEDEPLAEMLGNMISSLWQKRAEELEAIPWLDKKARDINSVTISVTLNVEYELMVLSSEERPASPLLLDMWSRNLQSRGATSEQLANIVTNIQLARKLPYPAMEVQQQLLLAAYFSGQRAHEMADSARSEALETAQASGLRSLEIQVLSALSLLSHASEKSVADFEPLSEDELPPVVFELLRQGEFELAEADLRRMLSSGRPGFTAWALAAGLQAGYPFVRNLALDNLSSGDSTRHHLTLDALMMLPREPLTEDELPESRRAFQQQLSKHLFALAARSEPADLARIIRVLPTEGGSELWTPGRLRPLLNSDVRDVVYFGLAHLSQQAPQATRHALLPELKRLLLSPEPGIRYLAVSSLPVLAFAPLAALIEPVLADPDLISGPLAWERLAKADAEKAKHRLTSYCRDASENLHVLLCLEARELVGIPVSAKELATAVSAHAFLRDELSLLPWSMRYSQDWLGLARALAGAGPAAQLRLLYLLELSTREMTLSQSPDLKIMKALQPVAGFMNHPDLQLRLLALSIWGYKVEGLKDAVLRQALGSPDASERVLALSLVSLQNMSGSGEFQTPLLAEQLLAWLNEPDRELLPPDADFLPDALESLKHGDPEDLGWHGYLAGLLSPADGPPLYQPALTSEQQLVLLRHPHPRVRMAALGLIASGGNPQHADALKALLSDPQPLVRSAAYIALIQLEQSLPHFYLQSLKDPLLVPELAESRLKFIVSDLEHRNDLMDEEYQFLLQEPVHRARLWKLASSAQDEHLQLWLLATLRSEQQDDPSVLLPLLSQQQTEGVREGALRSLLEYPLTPQMHSLLMPFAEDDNPYLQLEVLNALFDGSLRTRVWLELLAPKGQHVLNMTHLSFLWEVYGDSEDRQTANIEELVADALPTWLSESDLDKADLIDWLRWICNQNLPLSWRKAIFEFIVAEGLPAEAKPVLKELIQDPDLGSDAEYYLDELELSDS